MGKLFNDDIPPYWMNVEIMDDEGGVIDDVAQCSDCGEVYMDYDFAIHYFKYCPFCSAKMHNDTLY